MLASFLKNVPVESIGMFLYFIYILAVFYLELNVIGCFLSEIIDTMVNSIHNQKYFCNQKPVFDGRKNLYTREPLPIGKESVELEVTLPGEGKDRVFKVAIRHVSEVSLFYLDEALQGRVQRIPTDSVISLDVIMRHLHSMRWVLFFAIFCKAHWALMDQLNGKWIVESSCWNDTGARFPN